MITGVNWSPSIAGDNPFGCIGGTAYGESLDDLLGNLECESDQPVIVFVHLAYPGVQYNDTGKTNVTLPDEIGTALDAALTFVTSKWTKQRQKELKSEQARERREESLTRKNRTAVKEAAYAVMEEAFEAAARPYYRRANARRITAGNV